MFLGFSILVNLGAYAGMYSIAMGMMHSSSFKFDDYTEKLDKDDKYLFYHDENYQWT